MRKYKVGDKVVVKSDLHQGHDYSIYVNDDMARKKGEAVTITELHYNGLGYRVEGMTEDWRDDMFECLEDPFTNLKPGDIISSEGSEDKYLVLGVYNDGDKVALADLYDDSLDHRMKTMEQLRDGYWVKGHKPEEEVTELTLQEVADKVGVDVSKLRIKE